MATGIVEQLKEKLILQRFESSYGGSISTGASKRLKPSDAGYAIPDGYCPVGVTYFTSGNTNLSLDYLNLRSDAEYYLAVTNTGSGSSGGGSAGKADILFAPEWMVRFINADEPNTPISDITNEPVFKIANFTCSYSSLASNSGENFSREDMGLFVPDGYEIFSLININSGHHRVTISNCDPFSPDSVVAIRNTYSSAISSSVELGVVFINRKFMLPDTRNGLIIRCNIPTVYDAVNDHYELLGAYVQPPFYSIVTLNSSIFPTEPGIINTPLDFYLYHLDSALGYYRKIYPKKVDIVSGEEYINFSSAYKFIIPEDWTSRQIILYFTFD